LLDILVVFSEPPTFGEHNNQMKSLAFYKVVYVYVYVYTQRDGRAAITLGIAHISSCSGE